MRRPLSPEALWVLHQSGQGLQDAIVQWFNQRLGTAFLHDAGGYCVTTTSTQEGRVILLVTLPYSCRPYRLENIYPSHGTLPVVFQYDTPLNIARIGTHTIDPDLEGAERFLQEHPAHN